MVKFGNRGGNRLARGGAGGNRQQGGFKRGGGFRRGGGDDRAGQNSSDDGGQRRGGARRGGRFGGPRRGGGGNRREGGRKNRDHTSLDEDMLQYWDKAGVKDKREEAKVLEKEKLDRELEEYNKTNAAAGAGGAEQQA